MTVTPAQLVAFANLGTTGDQDVDEARAADAITTITGMVAAYCRGRHAFPDGTLRPGLDEVVRTAAARLYANPSQIAWEETVGSYSMRISGGFSGFSLPELAVLNRYRVRSL